VGASSKFGALFIKTPEGKKNQRNRKILSVRIVMYLLKQWHARGVLPKHFLTMFQSAQKADDLADSFLMTYTEELKRLKYKMSWGALELLFRYVISSPPFGTGHACQLELNADGHRSSQVYLRKMERLRLKQEKDLQLKQKKRKLDEKQTHIAPDGTLQRPPQPQAPQQPYVKPDLSASLEAGAHHERQAAMRKKRGPINDERRVPLLHLTERDECPVTTIEILDEEFGNSDDDVVQIK